MQVSIVVLVFLFALPSFATSLRERIITAWPNAGEKLIDVVKNHTSQDKNGQLIEMPEKAVDDAFNFFDRYHNTTRTFYQLKLRPVAGNTKYSEFESTTLETKTGSTISNHSFMVIFDLNQPRSAERLHIIDLTTGEVNSIEASHGEESECRNKPLFACTFISDRDSEATPLGFFSTGRSYYGKKHAGISISMDGLEKSSPRLPGGNTYPSTIIIHSADYVYKGHAGRSHGCVSLSLQNMNSFDVQLGGGALFYFYHSSLDRSSAAPVVSGLN